MSDDPEQNAIPLTPASLEHYPDVLSWVNDILDPDQLTSTTDADRLTELDRRVSHLLASLDIASEDTSAQVERIIDDISRGASRLTYDLHFMREGALSLQSVLHDVQSASKATLAAETNAALDRLHFLDTVRRNMEEARAVLREAESWGTLESDVTSLLGEANYEKAAERLSEASKSMAVFANTPEYESRRTLMVSLQNQLEAALSSALVAAVSSQDVVVCRKYFAIFSNIQRESEFRNYYYGSRRTPLVESWQSARLRDCDSPYLSDPSAQTFSAFLSMFYASFLSILQTERTSVPAIFPDPQATLSSLITSTLASLQPTFAERLSALSAHCGATVLAELIKAFHNAEQFAVATDKIFEKVGYTTTLSSTAVADTEGAALPRAHLRRRSSVRMSMSISRRMGPRGASSAGMPSSGALSLEWDHELFAPFADFQVDYGALERRMLDAALADALRAVPRASSDRARALRERAVDVFSAAEDAIGRCAAFTHGYGAEGLVQAVDHLVASFADALRAEVAQRRDGAGRDAGLALSASGEDLSDLDYTADDWADIQALLHLLEAVRALQDRTVMFEGKLRASLVQVSIAFRLARADPSGLGPHIGGTTRGAVQLLAQSSLNSAGLHMLLDSVDPDAPPPSRAEALLAPTPPSPDPRRSSYAYSPAPAPVPPLLKGARTAISDLARSCQIALQDTILAPLQKYLSTYAASPLWVAQTDPRTKRPTASGSATSEAQVPTFSLSPSDTMQRVYADDDALAFSLDTLPHVRPALLRALADPAPAHDAPPTHTHTRRAPSLAAARSPGPVAAQAPLHFPPEAVTAAWLASLGRTLLAHLTGGVLPRIGRLTRAGAAQLAADLGYLGNIVEALNVEWPPLGRWRALVELDDAEGKKRVREGPGEKEGGSEMAEDEEDDEGEREEQVLEVVARLRGWTS
ncbi:Golgi complex component 7-domain-containing protein [Amylocystis lapponica]|nr:Golgi complex component 7-domain-containing protein [Amylocystis lapponica]